MKNIKNEKKGITIVSLVIVVIVLAILASVATYSGIDAIESSKYTKFRSELKIMQTQVNNLYDRLKEGEEEISNLGTNLSDNEDIKKQAEKVFNAQESGITDTSGYKYFSQQEIQKLQIEGVTQEFFINIEKRSIVSYKGIQYKGKKYYTPEQIGLYNVDYQKSEEKPTFDINIDYISQKEYKITINNIQYSGYINKWEIKYQKEGDKHWNTSEETSFIIKEAGNYTIYVQNGDIISEPQIKRIGYIEEGLMLHYDGIINTRNGNNSKATVWEDLSGNNNDGTIKNGCTWNEKSINLSSNESGIIGNYSEDLKLNNYTIEIILESYVENSTNGAVLYDFYKEGNEGYFAKISDDSLLIAFGNTSYTYNYDFLNSEYPISIVVRCDKDNEKYDIYMNNEKIYNYTGNIDINQSTETSFGILNNDKCDEGAYLGKVNNIKIYNKVLTDSELQQNYEINKNRYNLK